MVPQVSPANPPIAPRKRRSKTNKGKGMGPAFGWLMLILLSPFLLLLDALRLGPSHRHTLYAFMLLTTVVIIITGLAFMVTEGPTQRLLHILNGIVDYDKLEEVPHDIELSLIHQSAVKYRMDSQLIMAVIKSESDFNPRAISHKGARGLMQVMPSIWRFYQPHSRCPGNHAPTSLCLNGDCIFDPGRNIDTGVHYLYDLVQRYHGRTDLAIEAYNAGLSNVEVGQDPRYAETRSYLRKVAQSWAEFRERPAQAQLKLVEDLRKNLRWLLFLLGGLWLDLFFWVSRRVLTKA